MTRAKPSDVRPFVVHEDACEVERKLDGEGIVTIDGADYPVRAGSTLFIPGDAEHGSRSTGPGRLRLICAFAADSFNELEYVFRDADTKSEPESQSSRER